MNNAFRDYVFGRSFNLNLSNDQVEDLARLCKGDEIAAICPGRARSALHRRGLVEAVPTDRGHSRWRPTRAGMLVYDLMVEAGEYQALEEKRREIIEKEDQLQRLEWDERFGRVEVKLKERFLKDAALAGGGRA
ncbi:hypothetical protein [Niveispirillum sp.]|uniref:hypothetical protein n=1 Tax=Niveispirillum sp. TaxID=1917217 RepID=UPI001B77DD03|nr:hypothetical protein [Niveispirillum sp.]MBP7339434.1 hypothetical protein [Niveispirillum sp.]